VSNPIASDMRTDGSLRRSIAGHVDGVDSAGIGGDASEARSASNGRVAQEPGADRAGLMELTRGLRPRYSAAMDRRPAMA
jgi:hypothetical protein